MQAIKKIVDTQIIRQFIDVPQSFGDTVELIILPSDDELRDKEWDWDPDDIKFTNTQHELNFESIEKEFGREDINKWK